MKIIHCSDLHLGKRPSGSKKFVETRYNDFFVAFEKLIEKISTLEVDVFIISGDLFDKKEINPNILERTEALFKKLKEMKPKLKIIVIEGNHDVINNLEYSWLEYLKNKNYIELFSYKKDYEKNNFFKIDDVNFYPVGYPGFMVNKVLEELAEKLKEKNLVKAEKNIIIVHTGVFGIENLPGMASLETLDLFKGNAIYIAGGHTHSYFTYPKDKPYFFIPGSLEFTNILNEKSDTKGAIYFDTETLEHKFLEIEARKRIKTEIFEYKDNLEEEFENFVEKLNLTGEELVILPLKIKNNEYINLQKLEEIAEGKGALKIYIKLVQGNENQKNILSGSEGFGEENFYENMEKNIIKNWDFLNENKNLVKNFTKLKEYFENKEEENFLNLFDEILEQDFK